MARLPQHKNLPRDKKPENKVLDGPLAILSNVELLATFIGSGIKGANAKQIAEQLLDQYGARLLTMDAAELTAIKGIGRGKAAKLAALLEVACRLAVGLSPAEAAEQLLYVRDGQQLTLVELLQKAGAARERAASSFKFIDLFAGIGGIRQGFEGAGGECMFSCEWDKYAKQTYEHNFGEIPFGDIKSITSLGDSDLNVLVPDHDILCAGFPCQPFSLAGVSKKNSLGRKHGFEDPTQGTLFFDIKRVLSIKRPKAFFLENVKNLMHHDKGRTWEVIKSTLEDDLGYVIRAEIVDGSGWVPQHRERIFIVGYDPQQITIDSGDIEIPKAPKNGHRAPRLSEILEKQPDPKHTLGPGTWATLERHKAHHAKAGNGFGYGLHTLPIPKDTVTRTMSARYHKDGAEILIEQKGQRPRRLTVKEATLLMGFPSTYTFGVSDTQAYRQLGNAVVVPAVKETAKEIAKVLRAQRPK